MKTLLLISLLLLSSCSSSVLVDMDDCQHVHGRFYTCEVVE